MRSPPFPAALAALAALAFLSHPLAPRPAFAQAGGPFDLSWSALSSGGSSSGGAFGVKGLTSPPNAGKASGGAFSIEGGWGGVISTIDVPDRERLLPRDFALLAPVPNPFTHRTTIAFELPRSVSVRVAVFDLGGRCVRVLVDQALAPGRHRVEWSGADVTDARLPGGMYFVSMDAGDFHTSSRIVLLH